jgi:hypothetical protein
MVSTKTVDGKKVAGNPSQLSPEETKKLLPLKTGVL